MTAPLLKFHLQLEADRADRVQHDGLVGLARRDDHVPHVERFDAAFPERARERRRRRLVEEPHLLRRGRVEDSAVLPYDTLEEIEVRKGLL